VQNCIGGVDRAVLSLLSIWRPHQTMSTVVPLAKYIEYISHKFSTLHLSITKLSGAAEARRAHNPEDGGSKPLSARFFFFFAVFECYRTECFPFHFLPLANYTSIEEHDGCVVGNTFRHRIVLIPAPSLDPRRSHCALALALLLLAHLLSTILPEPGSQKVPLGAVLIRAVQANKSCGNASC
jgi:hypothetical protein